jgi:hypothetical protein
MKFRILGRNMGKLRKTGNKWEKRNVISDNKKVNTTSRIEGSTL